MDQSLFERISSRLRHLISRGRIRAISDDDVAQRAQVKFSDIELVDGIVRLEEFGFTSNPPFNSDALVVCLTGDRSNGAVIATNHQASRPRGLGPGESAVFNQVGIKIYLSNGGLVIEAAGLPVSLNNAPTVTINASTKVALNTAELDVSGKITAGGDITDNASAGGKSMANMRSTYDGHDHQIEGIQTGLGTVTSKRPNQQV
ncbi:phage baseplate assembly protein V [Herbaspirillum huttiense]|uniref:phage baseplate assembly protein V n=1 Tax=Herbaspirillum huttiense TaxID=863372 RepID=UPI000585562F|nr:phage baseplate assembly protein V [Herbaspirillum huttiense]